MPHLDHHILKIAQNRRKGRFGLFLRPVFPLPVQNPISTFSLSPRKWPREGKNEATNAILTFLETERIALGDEKKYLKKAFFGQF